MNAKTAKKIRKVLKETGVDVRHSLYNVQTVTKGEEEKRTFSLSANCGRKLYKRAKASYGLY